MFKPPLVQLHKINNTNYKEVWDLQKTLQRSLIQNKRKKAGKDAFIQMINPSGHFILCEHKPVYTLGKSGSLDHLLMNHDELKSQEIEFFKINRGGDITFHGPGQITGYLILDLDDYYHDVHKYVRDIEEAIIRFLAKFDIQGKRIKDFTGVWIEDEKGQRKICAIGVHMSRWVSLHGFALNINTNLDYFKNIVPCGINEENKDVTNLSIEKGEHIKIEEIQSELQDSFAEVFGFELLKIIS